MESVEKAPSRLASNSSQFALRRFHRFRGYRVTTCPDTQARLVSGHFSLIQRPRAGDNNEVTLCRSQTHLLHAG